MDHMLLPAGSPPLDVTVPYVCGNEPYDGGLFMEYPVRKGRHWMADSDRQLHISRRPGYVEVTASEQEALFQSWMFFGLLSVLLGPFYDAEEFIDREKGQVTTAKFLPRLQQSWDSRVVQGAGDKAMQQKKMVAMLQVVLPNLNDTRPDFNPQIRLSIASIVDLLARSTTLFFLLAGVANEPTPATSIHDIPDEEMRKRMRSKGWCEFEINSTRSKFGSIQSLYFLSAINRLPARDHSGCTERSCRAYQIKKEKYTTKHVTEGCYCDDVKVDKGAVSEILYRGSFPLLDLAQLDNLDSDRELKPVASSTKVPYIAISHVWADGLGNPNENALPSCQLRYLYDATRALVAQDAQGPNRSVVVNDPFDILTLAHGTATDLSLTLRKNPNFDTPMLFWIDTLCCPAEEGESKNLSIRRLRDTNEQASHVLVLDAGLQIIRHSVTSSYELLLRTFSSAYVSRLWTLQEAVLAKRLWIQFKDGPVDIDFLFKQLRIRDFRDVRVMNFFLDLLQQKYWVRMFKPSDSQSASVFETDTIGAQLNRLDSALSDRSASKASDEALCIAILLNLNTAEITDVREDVQERMAKVWELVAKKHGKIPQRILTLPYPKLDMEGFRWAPSTLLSVSSTPGINYRLLGWLDEFYGVPRKSGGLLMNNSGFRVIYRPQNDSLVRNPWRLLGKYKPDQFYFQGQDGECYLVGMHLHMLPTDPDDVVTWPDSWKDKELGIMIFPDIGGRVAEKVEGECLFGEVEQIMESTLKMGRPNLRVITPASPAYAYISRASQRLAQELRSNHLTAELSDFQKAGVVEGKRLTACVAEMKETLDRAAAETLRVDPGLAESLYTLVGETEQRPMNLLSNWVRTWYERDFVAEKLSVDQSWCIG